VVGHRDRVVGGEDLDHVGHWVVCVERADVVVMLVVAVPVRPSAGDEDVELEVGAGPADLDDRSSA